MSQAQLIPHLSVVGHPNRGKSSLVATLTENDAVRIGPESGTTTRADHFDFVLQGRVLLRLTDTPGFQRARQLLAWLQKDNVAPAERPARVRAFLQDARLVQQFPDEAELLSPIMAGAGILYVVDGAQAVTPADEAEMEILRWTGQPRMAVINPMGNPTQDSPATLEQWQLSLGQFFQWVRLFNPLNASLAERQSLFRAMGELAPGWNQPLQQLCGLLQRRDAERQQQLSQSLARYWCEQMLKREPVTLLDTSGLSAAEDRLRRALDQAEAEFFNDLARAWGHNRALLEREADWDLGRDQLMNTETWYLWGLSQKELLLVSGAAGAATGLVVDAGLGGASLMLGAVSGGVVGTVGGWLASRKLPGKRLGWLPLARQKQFAGPVQHPNFPLVVMARALSFSQLLLHRTHADRSALRLRTSAADWSRQDQAQLLGWAKALQQDKWKAKDQDELVKWVGAQVGQKILLETDYS
jgi:hypothetical protein